MPDLGLGLDTSMAGLVASAAPPGPATGDGLQLESGDFLLLESGDFVLLE